MTGTQDDATLDTTERPVWIASDREALEAHEGVPSQALAWIDAVGFAFEAGSFLRLPNEAGNLAGAVFVPEPGQPLAAGKLPKGLPAGRWRLVAGNEDDEAAARRLRLAELGTALGAYRFTRYKTTKPPKPLAEFALNTRAALVRDGVFLARNLINTPTSDMGPAELEAAARELAETHGARIDVTSGEALERDFPLIHAVGRASASAPRLIDLRWGREDARKVTLVGKGVCFDTGGLDIKPAANMLLMKKDMGGAAAVLGLAAMLMAAKSEIALRVLVPAVENSVAGNAFRPSDVIASRKGLTVEIGNTDAEGRLVLADALALADEDEPDLLIDMATLTGAARVAMGPDVAPFFTRSNDLARSIEKAGREEADPVWRLPLHMPYRRMLKSDVADTNNIGGGGQAGAITAALFLDRFVEKAKQHVHFDIYGWCPEARPHCPKGGEAQAIRALFAMIDGTQA